MELGNAVWGNSRGTYEVERGQWQEKFSELMEVLREAGHKNMPYAAFENEVFSIFPYYWGECTCGYDAKEADWWENDGHLETCFSVRLEKFEQKLEKTTSRFSSDYNKKLDAWCKKNGYAPGRSGCKLHCDCGCHERWNAWARANYHAQDCKLVLPNFLYKPTGYTINWYKYPLRDSYANQNISNKEFRKIINKCIRSVEGK